MTSRRYSIARWNMPYNLSEDIASDLGSLQEGVFDCVTLQFHGFEVILSRDPTGHTGGIEATFNATDGG